MKESINNTALVASGNYDFISFYGKGVNFALSNIIFTKIFFKQRRSCCRSKNQAWSWGRKIVLNISFNKLRIKSKHKLYIVANLACNFFYTGKILWFTNKFKIFGNMHIGTPEEIPGSSPRMTLFVIVGFNPE